VAFVFIGIVIAHIYLGSVGMEGALETMATGEVDEQWAKEHHSIWYEEEMAKAKEAVPDHATPAE
ncbi:MAG: formate dehydrogenase subunit gamma, partial [Pseudomonadota bacterium]|nr:formate dehydrogenase subunit gamma [Pseudomonadota bacterium]